MAGIRGSLDHRHCAGTEVTQGPVTSEELLDQAEIRTGLARTQLLVLVAKSATVRHLATHPEYSDLFVLKGGTLLSNVYRSPRQSIADADYTYLDPQNLTLPDLEGALATDGAYGFELHPEQGQWTTANELFDGRTPFSMEGIALGRRTTDRQLKISVSVRAGEWLDPGPPLVFGDSLLAEDNVFSLNGLSRDELSAEKILGWCSKPLPKHFVDLACVARDHADYVDREKVADLVARKFAEEKDAPRYRNVGIRSLPDLKRAFTQEEKLADLRAEWPRFTDGELLLLPSELRRDEESALNRVENVERMAIDFWTPMLDRFR
jgi:predicted nucleotidyltransferase component of viral defense system